MLSKKADGAEVFGLSKTTCCYLTLNAKERVGLCAARREFSGASFKLDGAA